MSSLTENCYKRAVSLRGFVTELHRKHRLSQTEIARRAGLSQGLIYKILAGLGTHQMRTYKQLISAFPAEWSDYLRRHPSIRRELDQAFGWAIRIESERQHWGSGIRALLEAELRAGDLEVLPDDRMRKYRGHARETIGKALLELTRYREALRRKTEAEILKSSPRK